MEPADLAALDQTTAQARDDAAALIMFWTMLVAGGVPVATAKTILVLYAEALFRGEGEGEST